MHNVLVSFGLFVYLCFSKDKDLYVAPDEAIIEVPVLLGAESLRIPSAHGERYMWVAVCHWRLGT